MCMGRPALSPDDDAANFIRPWRERAGLTIEQLAERIGMSHSNLSRIERGKVPLGEEYVPGLARALGIKPGDIFRHPDEAAPMTPMVPVVGRVAADSEGRIIYATAHESGDRAPPPPGHTADTVVAVEVFGHSMRGYADDGSLVYFETQRSPPTPDMIGYPAVVETTDGRVLLKRLLKGSRSGLYDLESVNGPTLPDQKLRWAAEITAVIPPRQAQRIILRRGEPG